MIVGQGCGAYFFASKNFAVGLTLSLGALSGSDVSVVCVSTLFIFVWLLSFRVFFLFLSGRINVLLKT